MKNKYLSTSIGLYFNYFVHGMGLIIIALNMDVLSLKWGTDAAGVAVVVSSFGIGKILAVFFSGKISDKFGRKPSVMLGMLFYLLFFVGILWSPTTTTAYFFGIIAGFANSFLDTGTYPALMEAFPKKSGPANIIVKAFVQSAQFLLPLIVGFLINQQLWYGWSFILLIVILSINLIFISTREFPSTTIVPSETGKVEVKDPKGSFHFSMDEICLIIFGFVAQSLLYILSQWIAKYGSEVVHMNDGAARMLVSYGSIAALVCVLITFTLGNKGVKSPYFLMTYTFMASVISFILWAFPTPIVGVVGAIFLGYFSAGGLIQLGLTLLVEKSKRGKGLITSLYTIAEGIAVFTIPLAAAAISKVNIGGIFLMNSLIAFIGFSLVLTVFIRGKRNPAKEAPVSQEFKNEAI